MWLPNLADESWLAGALAEHAESLGVTGPVESVRLLDARLTHPHRPESPLCRGWATCVVTPAAGPPARLYVRGFPDAAAAADAFRRDRTDRGEGRSRHLAALDVVVWSFPDDPRLPALPVLVDPSRLARVLPAEVRDLLGTDRPRTTVVRYQPEASVTMRLDGSPGRDATVFAKHLADGVAAAAARHEALWAATGSCPRLRIAEPLGTDPDLGVLWTRGVTGEPLTVAVAPEALASRATDVGATLAALHATGADAPTLTLDDLVAELDKKATKLTRALPTVGAPLAALVASAVGRRHEVGRPRVVTAHGDFHLDQLVASEPGPVLVDLDSMVRAAPELDLAEFVVDLALRDLPGTAARDVSQALLTSYVDAAGTAVDPAVLRLCADAEFVNRCYRHLRRHAPGWQASLADAVARHSDVVALLEA